MPVRPGNGDAGQWRAFRNRLMIHDLGGLCLGSLCLARLQAAQFSQTLAQLAGGVIVRAQAGGEHGGDGIGLAEADIRPSRCAGDGWEVCMQSTRALFISMRLIPFDSAAWPSS